eukprot:m.882971 g.882971  ORF g.882971 m.882971 type:complete len:160 (-) comp23601_c0_seq3:247-726(-)
MGYSHLGSLLPAPNPWWYGCRPTSYPAADDGEAHQHGPTVPTAGGPARSAWTRGYHVHGDIHRRPPHPRAPCHVDAARCPEPRRATTQHNRGVTLQMSAALMVEEVSERASAMYRKHTESASFVPIVCRDMANKSGLRSCLARANVVIEILQRNDKDMP